MTNSMELPNRKQNRLAQYDYKMPNAYFITVCTAGRKKLFWKHVGATIGRPQDVMLSEYGVVVKNAIMEIPKRYPAVSVDHYVIMPEHIHLLLQIQTDSGGRPMVAPTVSTVVQQMKGAVSKKLGFALWQKGFYDHVVRGEQDYLEIWNYIEGNPIKRGPDTHKQKRE